MKTGSWGILHEHDVDPNIPVETRPKIDRVETCLRQGASSGALRGVPGGAPRQPGGDQRIKSFSY